MAGKRTAAICNCGARMKRIYMKIDNRFQGIGNGCLSCDRKTWDSDENKAMSAAWAVLKQGKSDSWTDTLKRGGN